ncbi:MAG TPA: hypothetical protein DIT58_03585 [Porticoccaceae bacterium]|nr:hypothetical protein [Porticoccaceae bacterium]
MVQPVFDLYLANRTDSCRFLLGRAGVRPLFVVGLNPSTANREKSDVTATKVARIAERSDYDGFVMSNLYPKRSTDPLQLPERADHRLLNRNFEAILALAAQQSQPHFWAAWGGDISTRPWLLRVCRRLVYEVGKLEGRWFCFGPGGGRTLTKAGHPRHPSRLSYAWQLQAFDAKAYLADL